MRFVDLLHETFTALTANKIRSLLTTLGIIIGISAVILLVSLMQGYEQTLFDQLGGDQASLLQAHSSAPFNEKDQKKLIQAIPGIRLIEVTRMYPGTPSYEGEDYSGHAYISGTTERYPEVQKITFVEGRWFTAAENLRADQVVVLGKGIVEDLFGKDADPVGKKIKIGKRDFTVIGVVGSSSMTMDFNTIFVPSKTGDKYLKDNSMMFGESIYILLERDIVMSEATEAVQNYFDVNYGKDMFYVYNFEEFANEIRQVFAVLTLIVSAIAGVSLLVGGIGIMNMMLTTVTERIREIGLRKALGAKRSAIVWQFLMESMALCIIGGLLGIALGYLGSLLAAYLIRTFAQEMAGDFHSKFSWWSVILAVGVSSFIGLVFGFYPARRAAKLDPVEALRYQ